MNVLAGKRLLIVEDTTIAATFLARELKNMQVDVVGLARSATQALEMTDRFRPHLILMDINLADGSSGIDAAGQISERYAIPVVFTTSYSDEETLSRAMETSPYGYVVKPFDAKTIRVTCETALRRFALERHAKSTENRLLAAVEGSRLGIEDVHDGEASFTFDGALSLQHRFGASTELLLADFLNLFAESERAEVEQSLHASSSLHKRIAVDNGGRWLDIVFTGLHMQNNTVHIDAVLDVTEHKRPEKSLKLTSVMQKHLAKGVALLDSAGNVIACNPGFLAVLDMEQSQITGKKLTAFLEPKNTTKPTFGQNEEFNQKVILVNKHGDKIAVILTVSHLSAGSAEQFIATVTDTRELLKTEQSLEALAFTDTLTGVGNRNYLKLMLGESVYRSAINALVFIDLDGFKQINDQYGHDVGDEVLCECALRLKHALREQDTLIRHGGDEFVILIQQTENLEQLGQRLLRLFKDPVQIRHLELLVTASIGIAQSNSELSSNDLLQRADIAMYEAKKGGKNRAELYQETFSKAVEYRLFVEQGLMNAIVNQELYSLYQPIVDNQGEIVALEALCRWRNHQHGDINPASFIPIAEETGLINELGLKMLREVCIAHNLLAEAGLGHIRIHVNVSILQLNSTSLIKQFIEFLDEFEVSPADLVLEVTESATHDINTRRVLRELHGMGFVLAVDDFGSGYASLAELSEPYTQIVKLDKSLIPNDNEPERKRIIVDSLVQLCTRLGKQVLLEGIENAAQAEFARFAGCDLMQGFYYHQPMSINSLLANLKIQQDKQPA
ncbi:two-component system response regulator [Salinimonas lutimaris]|uniref:two-component system response regulator n=1 Tax=Salinimonas lutimaris TaxID=914153 RepID=UPI0010BFD730|nr:EAL domain-containing protein [Salinimonas lutimaris]